MKELYLFITGNFIDAILFSFCAIFFLLCGGSFLAAWFSLRDETRYAYRRHKVDVDIGFSDWLIFRNWNSPELQAFLKKANEAIVNLLLLKRIAIRQTIKYSKYIFLYAGLLAVASGVQAWHMDQEINAHELSAESLDMVLNEEALPEEGVDVKFHDEEIATVTVKDKEKSASYEFVYQKDGTSWVRQGDGQKVLKIPNAIQNACAIIWLLLVWGFRYMRSV